MYPGALARREEDVMRRILLRLAATALVIGAGCTDDASEADASTQVQDPAEQRDGAAAPSDAAAADAGLSALDAAQNDAASDDRDAGKLDAGPPADTGPSDAAPVPLDALALLDAASDAAGDASLEASTTLSLTSPAFSAGQPIPDAHSCDGNNDSPALNWNALAAAKSYAVVLTDLSNSLVHWVLWDVPATTTMLAGALPKMSTLSALGGARQLSYNSVTGYVGPCPPAGAPHTYQFEVFALDVATLPGITMSSTRANVVTAIMMHDLSSAKLAGTFAR
jgi:Raf kinase inhibitor-like YbhB/YbcL family protein